MEASGPERLGSVVASSLPGRVHLPLPPFILLPTITNIGFITNHPLIDESQTTLESEHLYPEHAPLFVSIPVTIVPLLNSRGDLLV